MAHIDSGVRRGCESSAQLGTCTFESPNGALQCDLVDSVIQGMRPSGVDRRDIVPCFLIFSDSLPSGRVDQFQQGF